MSYIVKGFWSGASEADYNTFEDAQEAALKIIGNHEGATAVVEGPDIIANFYSVTAVEAS